MAEQLAEAASPTVPPGWHEWSFRACGKRLQIAVDGQVLLESQDADFTRGGAGVRVWNTSFYLDDIRVRKFVLPEPSVTVGQKTIRP